MKSIVTIDGKTTVSYVIRKRYNIKPRTRIKWIAEGRVITVVPISRSKNKENSSI